MKGQKIDARFNSFLLLIAQLFENEKLIIYAQIYTGAFHTCG